MVGAAILGILTNVAAASAVCREAEMSFRAVAWLALWTLLIGPVVGGAKVPSSAPKANGTIVRR